MIVHAKLCHSSYTGKTVLTIHLPHEFEPANRKLSYAHTWGSQLSFSAVSGFSALPSRSLQRFLSAAQVSGPFDLSVSSRSHISDSLAQQISPSLWAEVPSRILGKIALLITTG